LSRQSGSAVRIQQLRSTLSQLMAELETQQLTTRSRRELEAEIHAILGELTSFLVHLDPIRQPTSLFDPSNPKVVGRFIALALVAQQRQPLAEIKSHRFYGSGVYAIYYTGRFPDYAPLSGTETPIYVGQAAPAINNARTASEQGDRLSRRLDDHRSNIARATSTLDIADFEYRALVVQSGWETAAEDYLIHLFQPVWNNQTNVLFGIGKHGDSAGTRANRRSPWDTMHPGRSWASDERLIDAKTLGQIREDLADHFTLHAVFPDMTSILENFIDELRQI